MAIPPEAKPMIQQPYDNEIRRLADSEIARHGLAADKHYDAYTRYRLADAALSTEACLCPSACRQHTPEGKLRTPNRRYMARRRAANRHRRRPARAWLVPCGGEPEQLETTWQHPDGILNRHPGHHV